MEHTTEVETSWYVYDLGSKAGLVIRELAPSVGGDGGGKAVASKKCFRERASDDFTGQTVWASSVLLGRWVIANADVFKGRSVLELGSGCGLAGLATACCTDAASVCLSDFAAATVENLSHNVGANCGTGGLAGADSEAGLSYVSRPGRGSSPAGAPCRVCVARVNWDDEETWPAREEIGGGEAAVEAERSHPARSGVGGYSRRFDVVLAADVLYRRSYARKVAAVVRGVLRPGGLFVSVSPTAREGFDLLRRLLTDAGATAVDVELPDAWRGNPLRSPPAAEGEAGDATAAPLPPGSRVTLVSDAAARGLFPELAIAGYEVACTLFTMPCDSGEEGAPPKLES